MAVPNSMIKTLVVEALHHSHANTERKRGRREKTPGASALLVSCPPLFPSIAPSSVSLRFHIRICSFSSLGDSFSPSLCIFPPFFSTIICIHSGRRKEKRRLWGRAPAQAGLGVLMEKDPVIWVTSLFDAQGWNISAERDCISPTHKQRRCDCSGGTGLLLCRNPNHLYTFKIPATVTRG